MTLKNGSAREIGRILEQFLGKDVVTVSENALNQLISGTGEERASARQLIARFDVDTRFAERFGQCDGTADGQHRSRTPDRAQ